MSIVSTKVKIYSNDTLTNLVTTVNGTTSLTQTLAVTGLNSSTNYWAVVEATDNNNHTGYSVAKMFTTAAVNYIFSNYEVNYESDYDTLEVGVDVGPSSLTFTECGVQFALTSDFSGNLIIATNNNNFFSGDVTGFAEHTTYYYRFFATTAAYGTQYYAPQNNIITTNYNVPTLSVSATNITDISADFLLNYSGSYPVSNLRLAIAESGGQWQDIQIDNMSGTQSGHIPYTLLPNTQYDLELSCDFYDGERTQSATFTTLASRPSVAITGVTNITPSGADVEISIS